MLKRHGGKIMIALVALVLGAFLVAGTVPAFAAGYGPGTGNGQGRGMGKGMGRNGGSLAAIVTDILGISRSDLAAERQAGKSLLEIAAAKGMNQEQLVSAVLAKKQQNLAQALNDGRITQDQYNQCVQQMKTNIEQNLARTATGPNGKGGSNGPGRGNVGMGRGAGNGSSPNCTGICGR